MRLENGLGTGVEVGIGVGAWEREEVFSEKWHRWKTSFCGSLQREVGFGWCGVCTRVWVGWQSG